MVENAFAKLNIGDQPLTLAEIEEKMVEIRFSIEKAYHVVYRQTADIMTK